MSYFDGVQSESKTFSDVEQLNKALEAGYGSDAAVFVNGRAMIPEDLEATTMNVLAKMKEDCKITNSLKTRPAKSTVHEYNRRTEEGDYKFLSVAEGGESPETNQEVERKTLNIKYLQTRRSVTKQMESVQTFEDALASEKMTGVSTIIKGIEHQIFHGDSSIIPTEFDGLLAQIRAEEKAYKRDLRGATIGSVGESIFDDVAEQVLERGAYIDKAMFPVVLAKDIKGLFTDRLRMLMGDERSSFKGLPAYDTATGSTIKISGEDAGPDKFFRVKGKVVAQGSTTKRPAPPTSVTGTPSTMANSQFAAADEGDYMYTVHAVNASGISQGTSVSAAVAVAAGSGVTLTITPASTGEVATGFIICRSKKDGTEVMEMAQVKANSTGTTTYVDLNADLPGTASMIFLPETRLMPALELVQLLPVSTIPLYPTNKAETPFLIAYYGALENKAPEWCAEVKNIAYSGGF